MPFEIPDRLKALPPYLFVEMDRRRRAAVEAGKDVINLGIGDPDQPTPGFVLDRLRETLPVSAHHRYPQQIGVAAFREAAARFMQRRYGQRLDPVSEILTLIGSKEGLGHLPLAVLNPGDVALVPDPGYPVYQAATLFAGGRPHFLRLTREQCWLPDLAAIPSDVARRARLMFLNYPNNPIGAVAPRGFLEAAVRFARQYDLVIAYDAAYNEVYFDTPPLSILEIPGGREVAIELHSLSKTFNMTGWRIGFAAGRADVIAALARIKSNMDSSQFAPIQEAGAAALDGIERPEIGATVAMYRARRDAMCAGLRAAGFHVEPPPATFYVWAGIPARARATSDSASQGSASMNVCARILDEAGVVCVPGNGFGAAGEGYVRFALTVDLDRIRTAAERIAAIRW
ncbi:MAG: LL-diaminopimelate aminotransferase [Phycisphaerae bacterium]|nr:LL-diaminopimelate aminotransferase [Phycisphaerae bacterium]